MLFCLHRSDITGSDQSVHAATLVITELGASFSDGLVEEDATKAVSVIRDILPDSTACPCFEKAVISCCRHEHEVHKPFLEQQEKAFDKDSGREQGAFSETISRYKASRQELPTAQRFASTLYTATAIHGQHVCSSTRHKASPIQFESVTEEVCSPADGTADQKLSRLAVGRRQTADVGKAPFTAGLAQQPATREPFVHFKFKAEKTRALERDTQSNWLALDGTQDSAVSGAAETETGNEKAKSSSDIDGQKTDLVPKTSGALNQSRALRVADRIRVFELKNSNIPTHSPTKPNRKHNMQPKEIANDDYSQDSKQAGAKASLRAPVVFPLHIRKYHRRAGHGGTVPRVETPMYRSSSPEGEQVIHSPQPLRTIPAVQTPPGTPGPLEAGVDLAHTALKQANEEATWQSKPRVSQFAHFHGTRGSCVRHGRKSSVNLDACPDCVAELGIQKREVEQVTRPFQPEMSIPAVQNDVRDSDTSSPPVGGEAAPAVKLEQPPASLTTDSSTSDRTDSPLHLQPTRNSKFDQSLSPLGDNRAQSWGSTRVQASTSVYNSGSDGQSSRSNSETNPEFNMQRIDSDEVFGSRPKAVRFRELSDGSGADQLVVSRDLGEGLDAMILERGGRLERVITNARHGEATMEMMAKLSRELVSVSNAIADAHVDQDYSRPEDSHHKKDRTVVVDGNARRPSVPELLNLFGEATGDLEPGLIRKESIQSTCPEFQPDPIVYHYNEEDSSSEQSFTSLDDDDDRGRTRVQLAVPQTMEAQIRGPHGQRGSVSPYTVSPIGREPDHQQHGRNVPTTADGVVGWPIIPPLDPTSLQPPSSSSDPSSSSSSSRPNPSRADSNLGSSYLPVKVIRSSIASIELPAEAILPSHIFKASDFPSSPPLHSAPSPLLFTDSTMQSMTNSAANSAQTSPSFFTKSTAPSLTSTPLGDRSKLWTAFPPEKSARPRNGEQRADSQVIKHVMRMEKNRAVQEAAEAERQARRKKSLGLEGRRTFSFGKE